MGNSLKKQIFEVSEISFHNLSISEGNSWDDNSIELLTVDRLSCLSKDIIKYKDKNSDHFDFELENLFTSFLNKLQSRHTSVPLGPYISKFEVLFKDLQDEFQVESKLTENHFHLSKFPKKFAQELRKTKNYRKPFIPILITYLNLIAEYKDIKNKRAYIVKQILDHREYLDKIGRWSDFSNIFYKNGIPEEITTVKNKLFKRYKEFSDSLNEEMINTLHRTLIRYHNQNYKNINFDSLLDEYCKINSLSV